MTIFPNKTKYKSEEFFNEYFDKLTKVYQKIDKKKIIEASNLINLKIKKNKNLFVCGNGGSSAIASHFVCDYMKQLNKYTKLKANVSNLFSETTLVSAIANDISYDEIFRFQLKRKMKKNDLLICISSSGNSKNIINAVKYSKSLKNKIISFTNFDGGYLKNNSDILIHSKINNYGIGEDINHILMHAIMQHIALKNLKLKKRKIIL